ncbi:MAG: cobalamin-independent methionine synthase II family protein [Proteobacteria bacterium]|nr:cobalamin-independent methionine synthase II family protein [Pseudomonadota bacterium]
MLTTTSGSYPKPDYLPLQNPSRGDPTRNYSDYLAAPPRDAKERFERGTREAVRDQVEVGIDIPTDGEIRREHYIYYHCRHLRGFSFDDLAVKEMRDGSWRARVPTIGRPIEAGAPFLAEDWRSAQAVTERPVKITVPGPMTIADSTVDTYYGDQRRLGAALADALNVEIRALADAGCTWIQVDEPLFARRPEGALAYGIDHLSRCFHGVPAGVTRVVHVCCGYPAELDMDDYPKADPHVYATLADALEAAEIDAFSLEDAHRHNDLALLERFSSTKILLGLVDVGRSRVDPVDEIVERLRAALYHIDADRLIAAPDCGLNLLDRATALAKLGNLVAAAKIVGPS